MDRISVYIKLGHTCRKKVSFQDFLGRKTPLLNNTVLVSYTKQTFYVNKMPSRCLLSMLPSNYDLCSQSISLFS